MHPDHGTSAQLATFDPPLAEAVAAVLRREGLPAAVEPLDHSEAEVRVPAARRDEALALLASHMEDVRAVVDGLPYAGTPTPTPVPLTHDLDEESGPPIVMERLRRMGFGVALVLAPLLVVSLASTQLPIGYSLALFIGGLAAVVYWRNRQVD